MSIADAPASLTAKKERRMVQPISKSQERRLAAQLQPVAVPRFMVGDKVKIYKPGHSEHGMTATVARVITIEEYGGPASRGPHAYYTVDGWKSIDGRLCGFGGPLPDAMVEAG